MPSETLSEQQTKQDSALAFLSYYRANTLTDCPNAGDQLRAWLKLIEVQAQMESLWPRLSEKKDFEEAIEDAAETLPTMRTEYAPQLLEYVGRMTLDYALWLAISGDSTQSASWLGVSLRRYQDAERLYLELDDQDTITRWQIHGYQGETLEALKRYEEAMCHYETAYSSVRGGLPRERVFRAKMRRLIDNLDRTGKALPGACIRWGMRSVHDRPISLLLGVCLSLIARFLWRVSSRRASSTPLPSPRPSSSATQGETDP